MMIQWFFISGYVLQNMLQVGFGKTFQNLPYFDQSVAYVRTQYTVLEGKKRSELREALLFIPNAYRLLV